MISSKTVLKKLQSTFQNLPTSVGKPFYPNNTFDCYSAVLSSIMDPKIFLIMLDKAKIPWQKGLLVYILKKKK